MLLAVDAGVRSIASVGRRRTCADPWDCDHQDNEIGVLVAPTFSQA